MMLEKIFSALEEDDKNSGLEIIIYELQRQGYQVEINGLLIDKDIVDNEFISNSERLSDQFKVRILLNGSLIDRFQIKFVDYHKIIFNSWEDYNQISGK